MKNILLLDFVGTTATTSDVVIVVVDGGGDKTSLSKLSSMPTLLEEFDVDVAFEMSPFKLIPSSQLDSCWR